MNEPEVRKSHLEIEKLYFWTATINNWYKLLDPSSFKDIIISSLQYLTLNPTMQRWNLCKEPSEYYYSSAGFYETGITKFGFLKHIGEAS